MDALSILIHAHITAPLIAPALALTAPVTALADIDECAPAPCLSGGTCIDQVDGYTCDCAAGFTGVICETGKIIYMMATLLLLVNRWPHYWFATAFLSQNTPRMHPRIPSTRPAMLKSC